MITLLAHGSRGDVQPFVALAYALKQAGHPVRLVLNAEFASLAGQYGLEYRLLPASVQSMLETQAGQDMLKSGSLLRSLIYFLRETRRNAREVVEASWRGCQDSSLLLYSMIDLWGYDIAEKLGIHGLPVLMIPSLPTRQFPAPQGNLPDWKGPFNRLTHKLLLALVWQVMYRPLIAPFRHQTLGLAGLPHLHALERLPQLHPYSPSVVPLAPDWPACVHVTGYWFLPAPEDWQPSLELCRFLEDGDPPVYVGFGSMANRDAAGMTRLALEAGRLAGVRLVMARGWGGLSLQEGADRRTFFLDAAPHDWLFPRMAAVVHHGGAGTTAAGLRAGVPSVIIPHFDDQPFWANRVHALGASPPPIPRRRLSAEKLAQAISDATQNKHIRANAQYLADRIRAENGLQKAIEVIVGKT